MQRTFDDLGTPLSDVTFCVIDLETTGGSADGDTITEVGAVKVRGGQCLGTFQTLVNPGRAIPPSITVLTGISESMVVRAPRIEQVLPALLEFCGDAVIVGHNVRFDLGFLNAALVRSRRQKLSNAHLDTVALARRLLRDEVPNCRLGTLASRFRLDHQPSHRALDDALATVDLLHLLIERAACFGVMGLDDLQLLPKLAGHPQVAKLKLTNHLPRRPGVYLFHDPRGEVLYVGKATNLRQRVRSYFGSDDRRKIGPMLREAHRVSYHETPDPLSAAVLELRYIQAFKPRYNKQGTTSDRYVYIRLSTDEAWPRLSVVKQTNAKAFHLGPLPSRTMANLVIEAIHSVAPLRRCTNRLGRAYVAPADATPCTAAQLGVCACPCAGHADARNYAAAVETVLRGLQDEPDLLLEPLRARMLVLASSRRFEEAAATRDRAQALSGAVLRQRLINDLRSAGEVHLSLNGVDFVIDQGRLIDVTLPGQLTAALPLNAAAADDPSRPLSPTAVDETLCLARYLQAHRGRIQLHHCSGIWVQSCGTLQSFQPPSERQRAA